MIDSKFIIRYTNGLYCTPPEFSPRYDEFRDMFSSGQILSKEWAVNELKNLDIVKFQEVLIAGSWFGTLGMMLKDTFPTIELILLDIDPRCEPYTKNVVKGATVKTGDMYDYKYTEDIVINTACEHIPDVGNWLSLLKSGTIVLLQSNNFFDSPDHVNCVNTIDEFKVQVNLSEVMYAGELKTPMYTRFMIIGKT